MERSFSRKRINRAVFLLLLSLWTAACGREDRTPSPGAAAQAPPERQNPGRSAEQCAGQWLPCEGTVDQLLGTKLTMTFADSSGAATEPVFVGRFSPECLQARGIGSGKKLEARKWVRASGSCGPSTYYRVEALQGCGIFPF